MHFVLSVSFTLHNWKNSEMHYNLHLLAETAFTFSWRHKKIQ